MSFDCFLSTCRLRVFHVKRTLEISLTFATDLIRNICMFASRHLFVYTAFYFKFIISFNFCLFTLFSVLLYARVYVWFPIKYGNLCHSSGVLDFDVIFQNECLHIYCYYEGVYELWCWQEKRNIFGINF